MKKPNKVYAVIAMLSGILALPVAAFVIVVAGMRAAEPILVPLLIASFLAIVSASFLLLSNN